MKEILEKWSQFLIEGEDWNMVIVNVFIFNEDHKFLMIRRTETAPFKPGAWDIPGGLVEEGEDLAEAARRETKEETQLNVGTLVPIPTHARSQRNYFVTDQFSGVVEFLPNPEHGYKEHDEHIWASFEEYQQIPNKTITAEQNVLAAMKALEIPLPPPYDVLFESYNE
tara:strand:- start:118 stop:621 length:504 start_codon:yes stop_codon:yes gene_type:complete